MTMVRVLPACRTMMSLKNCFVIFSLFAVGYILVIYSYPPETNIATANALDPFDLFKAKLGNSKSGDDSNKEFSLLFENDSLVVCFENSTDSRYSLYSHAAISQQLNSASTLHPVNGTKPRPVIYFVTPTYPRREQIAEITRLGQTLMHIPYLHWIVADDTDGCNRFLNNQLKRFGIPYTHIASPMPDYYRTKKLVPRGVANRRAALNWIRTNNRRNGVLYFGDDDNTFDLKLFSEIRDTKKVSMFPVGLIGDYAVSTPIVRNGRVEAFFDSWPAKRKWPVDMAGFAVNLDYLALSPNATMPYRAGYEEDEFLKSIGLKMQDIEPKANNCTEILVWHTQTKSNKPPRIHVPADRQQLDKVNLGWLLKQLDTMGVSHVSETEGTIAQVIQDGKAKPMSSWLS